VLQPQWLPSTSKSHLYGCHAWRFCREIAKKALGGAHRLPLCFCFSFLLLFSRESRCDSAERALEAAREAEIATDPPWLALLHYANQRCYVTDPTFLLSAPLCDPARELELLLIAVFSAKASTTQDITCRFPARVAFIAARLAPLGFTVPRPLCADFLEYKKRAPADEVSLVFASENIVHPMSMMGHVFIKVQGRSEEGVELEHAVSFFTRIDSVNPLVVFADSFFLGMPSFFALSPFIEVTSGYRNGERRSLWEYRITASDLQRDLIHSHVWELKSINTPYYFVGYNCATVVYFIVALANPTLLNHLNGWVTPIDVVRRARTAQVLSERTFLPSIDWQIRAYEEALGTSEAQGVLSILRHGSEEEVRELAHAGDLRQHFASALIQREMTDARNFPDRKDIVSQIFTEALATRVPDEVLIENVRDPLSGPLSSRYGIGMVHMNGVGYGKLEFLPASHSLSDDNRRSYAESALELGHVAVLYNPEKGRPLLQNLSLYAYESLVPFDTFVGGLSSRVSIGVEQQWNRALSPFTAGHATVGLGRTYALGDDIRVFGLMNVALNYGDGTGALSYYPEVGATMYEILSMKSIATYRVVCGEDASTSCYQRAAITQSFLPSGTLSPYVSFDTLWDEDQSTQIYEAGLKRYF
jgi:hypothetical protein